MFNRLKNFWQRKKIAKLKRRYVFLLVIFLVIFVALLIIYSINIGSDERIVYGVTYSHKYAQELGLNIEQFEQDLNSNNVKETVSQDITSGNQAGVNSTPSFFLNGTKITNPRSYDKFRQLVQEQLDNQ